ncbi:MAG: DUF4147 domain-containing protein [Burkholderiaceae bacterium]
MNSHTQQNLVDLWQTGVDAVDGERAVTRFLANTSHRRPHAILSVGKAAGAMALGALKHFGSPLPCLVVTKPGHADCALNAYPGTEILETSHPEMSEASIGAGRRAMALIQSLSPDTELLMLVSGGASALMEVPGPGVSNNEILSLNSRLVASGADIEEMNQQRIGASSIKGGRLLSRFPGRKVTVLAIADVPHANISVIGSGIGDNMLLTRARGDECAAELIVASNQIARQAIGRHAHQLQTPVIANEESLYGDVHEVAARIGRQLRQGSSGLYVWGGEPTVVLPDAPGRGGRAQMLALLLTKALQGCTQIDALVAGTDGTDGPGDVAGAFVDTKASFSSQQAEQALARADAGTYLQARDSLYKTGPTGTNVMDLVIALKR